VRPIVQKRCLEVICLAFLLVQRGRRRILTSQALSG